MEHPFAADGDTLAGLVGGTAGSLAVRLPSYASGPVESPELVRDPLAKAPSRRGAVRLRSWLVAVVWVDGEVPAGLPDCRPGASAKYLHDVVAFAKDLVERGRVLPEVDSHRARARWRAALSGVDALRHADLRAGMPSAFRAAEGADDVLQPALDSLVDTQVRRRLRGFGTDRTGERGAGGQDTRGQGTTGQGADGRDTAGRDTGEQGANGRGTGERGANGRGTAERDAGEQGTGRQSAGGRGTVGRWLAALAGEVADFEADPAEVNQLRAKVVDWGAGEARGNRVRTCFRLSSPEQGGPGDDGWRLEFLLQAVDEPSVLVTAQQVWRRQEAVLRRWVSRPQEVLLGDLGRASRLYPALDRALTERKPAGLVLDVDGAYEFLTHASLLAQAGFGVLLPSWWRQPRQLGLTLTAAGRGTAGAVAKESELGLKVLVDYRWDLALGDERLTEAELSALAKAKTPLVRLRKQWVHVDRKRLAEGLAFLARGGGQMSAAQVLLHSGFGPEDADLPLPLNAVRGEGWLGDLLSGEVEHRLEPVEPPAGLTATLRPYQLRGLSWLVFLDRLGLGACLADDMGLGKTVQLLALEAYTRQHETRPPTLLICPMSVVGNWQREAARFTPGLRVHVHHGVERSAVGLGQGHDLVITTYAVAARDVDALAEVGWDRVVLDEAQNVKNSATRQSRAVRALPARHRVALTGTPVENRLAELWSIMDFVNPGVLGTVNTFRARFAVPVERHHDEDAAVRLRRITRPFVLRRLKTDPRIITDLPDKIEVKQLCTLTAEQASLYQAVIDDMFARIAEAEGIKRKGLVLATMSRLKQVCNHPAQLLGDGSRVAGRSGKVARLEEILDEALADGDKALCFTQFTEFGGLVVPHLAARFDTEVLFLHGGTSKKARDEMVRRFQSDDGPSIFVLSLKAGGTGLNLTAANHVIHLDRWWNPAVEDQATDRAFRIGQRNHVQVRKFVCVGTVEERIDRMIEEKRGLAQLVVGAGEDWLTELSTGELRDLFALSGEAVGE
ncbi:SNF2 family DNA or RNA helicase [Saccharothrix tamanrassetensis]|uniref:SNF2 family DNA or RNA helicase n=1 Tax=Saccharothrix tamanrassetensis TaxID=1051531 RepID=A0A841CKJ3_9PSEU|nr:SNF2-related protein [Saccharothrix tamanrassetensis]MBB5957580.1 SNF2 family DNA or RNA helicase [Saccharothrix tamanrassetensis]